MKIDIELLHKERKQWRENSLLQSQSILRLSQELDNLRKQKEVLQEKLLKSATQDQMEFKVPIPLSREEKREAKMIAFIVVLGYVLALGYYLS